MDKLFNQQHRKPLYVRRYGPFKALFCHRPLDVEPGAYTVLLIQWRHNEEA